MIGKNILANACSRAWSFISIYAFFPFYLKLLGIDAFGLVGFYSTLVSIMLFVDVGFSAVLNREMARLSANGFDSEKMCNLLKTYEVSYLFLSALVMLAVWVAAPFIALNWLKISALDSNEVIWSLRLMGTAIALQLPAGLYVGGLMGLQLQVKANYIQILWGIFRSLGGLLALYSFEATIFVFSFWQIIANFLYLIMSRSTLWNFLKIKTIELQPRFTFTVFANTWRYALGMAWMSGISVVLTQADKVIVSSMLSLEMFGFYTFATTLALIPMMLANPIAMAVFPRFTSLVEQDLRDKIVTFYYQTSEFISVLVIPSAFIICMFSWELIYIWTNSRYVADNTATVTKYLVLGQLLQAITIIPYYLALAHGNLKINVKTGIVSVFILVPLLIFWIGKFSLVGAGMAWLGLNVLTIPVYIFFLHKSFMPKELTPWVLRTVFIPASVAFSLILLARLIFPFSSSRIFLFFEIGTIWCVVSISVFFVSHTLRDIAIKSIKNIFR